MFKKTKYFRTIFLNFIFLICVFVLTALCVTGYYTKQLQRDAAHQHNIKLQEVSNSLNQQIKEINQMTTLLLSADEFFTLMYSDQKIAPEKYYSQLSSLQHMLTRYKCTKTYIKDAYILDSRHNIVISQTGTSTIEEFYGAIHTYKNYNSYTFHSILKKYKDYQLLTPTTVVNSVTNAENIVIPMVHLSIESMKLLKPFIIDLDINFIYDLLREAKLTASSQVFMLDKQNKYIYATQSQESESVGIKDVVNIFYEDIQQTTLNKNGKNYICFLYDAGPGDKFSYCVVVPRNEFIMQSLKHLALPILVTMVTVLSCIMIAFYLSGKLYKPVNNILQELSHESKEIQLQNNQSDIQYINQQIKEITQRNKHLTENINVALPYVCERYLISALNDNKAIVMNEDLSAFLQEYEFQFQHNFFTVINTSIIYSKRFLEDYTKEDQFVIHNNILAGIKSIYKEKKDCFIVSLGNYQVCTIINSAEWTNGEQWLNEYKKLHEVLSIDESLLNLQTCSGLCHAGLEGLYQSYQESSKMYVNTVATQYDNVVAYSNNSEYLEDTWSKEEEQQLTELIANGKVEELEETIKDIIINTKQENMSPINYKYLLVQLYQLGIRLANKKQLAAHDVLGNKYQDIMSHVALAAKQDIYDYVLLFLKSLAKLNESNKKERWTEQSIREYLTNHYKEEIYLDKIAETFNVTPKHMSRLIKEIMGVSFHKYIAKQRMDEAKRLLLETNMTIEEISSEIGFNSRYPFIRTFKKLENCTPTEYRKYSKLQTKGNFD